MLPRGGWGRPTRVCPALAPGALRRRAGRAGCSRAAELVQVLTGQQVGRAGPGLGPRRRLLKGGVCESWGLISAGLIDPAPRSTGAHLAGGERGSVPVRRCPPGLGPSPGAAAIGAVAERLCHRAAGSEGVFLRPCTSRRRDYRHGLWLRPLCSAHRKQGAARGFLRWAVNQPPAGRALMLGKHARAGVGKESWHLLFWGFFFLPGDLCERKKVP